MNIVLRKIRLYTENSLQKHDSHVSCIGLGRMTISAASRIFDSDNMDFVEIEH